MMNPSCEFIVQGTTNISHHNLFKIPVFADDSVERIKERIWYTLRSQGIWEMLLYEEIYLYQYSSEPADLPKLFSLLPNHVIRREQLIPLLSFPMTTPPSMMHSIIPDAMNYQELMQLLETQKWTLAMKHPIGARFDEHTPWPAECDPFVFMERRLRHRRPNPNNRRPDVAIHLIHNDNTLWTDVSSTIHVCLARDVYQSAAKDPILFSTLTQIFYPALYTRNVTDGASLERAKYTPELFREYKLSWLEYHNKMDESLQILRSNYYSKDDTRMMPNQGIRRLHIELNDANTDKKSKVHYCETGTRLPENCGIITTMELIFKRVYTSDLIPFIMFCEKKDKCFYRAYNTEKYIIHGEKKSLQQSVTTTTTPSQSIIREYIARFQRPERITLVIQVAKLHDGMGKDLYEYVYLHIVPDTATKTSFALQIELKMKDSAICPQDTIHDLLSKMMIDPLRQINRHLKPIGKMQFLFSGQERILYMDYCVFFPPQKIHWEKFPCIDAVIHCKPTTHVTPIKKKSSRSRSQSKTQEKTHCKYYWRRVEKGTLPFRVQISESKWTIYRISDWNYLPIIEQQMNGIMALSSSSTSSSKQWMTRLKELCPYVKSIVHPVEKDTNDDEPTNNIVVIAPIYEDDVYDEDGEAMNPLVGSVGGAVIEEDNINSDISDNEEEEEEEEKNDTELYMRRISNQFCAITPNNHLTPVELSSSDDMALTILPENKVGFLPKAVANFLGITGENHRFMRQGIHHPTAYVVSDNNTHYVQSFLGYITFLYNVSNNVSVDADQMREILVDAVDLDTFVKAQNGKLLAIFASILSDESRKLHDPILDNDNRIKMMDMDDKEMDAFDHTQIYHSVDWNNDAHARFMMTSIRAYRKFQQHIRDPHAYIDHTILWDILSLPNRKLFVDGYNIIMMELFPGDSYLERVEFICPQSIFSSTSPSMSPTSPSVIILKTGVYYEPIICMDSPPSSNHVFDDGEEIVGMVNAWKSAAAACDDSSDMKINHVPNALTMKELQSRCNSSSNPEFCTVKSYIVNRENTEITGVQVKFASDPDLPPLFLPILPCAIIPSFTPLLKAPVPLPFLETYSLLRKHQVKMRCHPLRMVAISDGQWIVGILIETNGFIPTEPIEKTDVPDEIVRNLAVHHHRCNVRMPMPPMNRRQCPHFKEENEDDELDLLRYLKMERQFYSVFSETLLRLIQDTKMASKQPLESELRKLATGYIEFVNMDANVALMYMEECELASSSSSSSCAIRSEIDGILLIPRTSPLHPERDNDVVFFEKFAKDYLRDRVTPISLDDQRIHDPQNARYVIGPNESVYAIHPDIASRNLFQNLRIDM